MFSPVAVWQVFTSVNCDITCTDVILTVQIRSVKLVKLGTQGRGTTKCVLATLWCIIKESGSRFLMFVMAVYVNNMAQAWTFIKAVSPSPCAAIPDWMLSAELLYPQAIWSNQRRAALIAWPWQGARWSGKGLHLPGEKVAPRTLKIEPSFPSFLSPSAMTKHQEDTVHSQRGSYKVTPAKCPFYFPSTNASNLKE